MFFYALYLAGWGLCQFLPRRLCYGIARGAASFSAAGSPTDRKLVRGNLAAVLGLSEEEVPSEMVVEVFRSFSMYLVDFFRFSRLRAEQVPSLIRIEGVDHMREALALGHGAVGMTAHLGNYELCGAALSLMGLPVSAVVLTHQNRRVDAFFERQRTRVGVEGIAVQRMGRKAFLEACLSALKEKRILGLVADRDYFNHGIEMPLFGKMMRVPTGPASFSIRTGAPVVPSFVVREPDGSYRFVMDRPIRPSEGLPREEAIRKMTQECLEVMMKYIRQYPTQWYMFQEFWRSGPAVIR